VFWGDSVFEANVQGGSGVMRADGPWGDVPAQEGVVYALIQYQHGFTLDVAQLAVDMPQLAPVGGLLPGATYGLSWWQNARPDYYDGPEQGPDDGNDINVAVNGAVVFSEWPIQYNASGWMQRFSSTWVQSSSALLLSFYTTNPQGADFTTFIDSVQLLLYSPPLPCGTAGNLGRSFHVALRALPATANGEGNTNFEVVVAVGSTLLLYVNPRVDTPSYRSSDGLVTMDYYAGGVWHAGDCGFGILTFAQPCGGAACGL
jgi:hypothetical protein